MYLRRTRISSHFSHIHGPVCLFFLFFNNWNYGELLINLSAHYNADLGQDEIKGCRQLPHGSPREPGLQPRLCHSPVVETERIPTFKEQKLVLFWDVISKEFWKQEELNSSNTLQPRDTQLVLQCWGWKDKHQADGPRSQSWGCGLSSHAAGAWSENVDTFLPFSTLNRVNEWRLFEYNRTLSLRIRPGQLLQQQTRAASKELRRDTRTLLYAQWNHLEQHADADWTSTGTEESVGALCSCDKHVCGAKGRWRTNKKEDPDDQAPLNQWSTFLVSEGWVRGWEDWSLDCNVGLIALATRTCESAIPKAVPLNGFHCTSEVEIQR